MMFLDCSSWAGNPPSSTGDTCGTAYSADPGDAIRDDDEEQPGKHKIIFRTKGGDETCYRGLPVVGQDQPQRTDLAKGQPPGDSDAAHRPLSTDDHWAVFIDTKASADSRVAALTGLRGSPLESDAAGLPCRGTKPRGHPAGVA